MNFYSQLADILCLVTSIPLSIRFVPKFNLTYPLFTSKDFFISLPKKTERFGSCIKSFMPLLLPYLLPL